MSVALTHGAPQARPDPGLWVIVIGDLLVFLLSFCLYAWAYRGAPEAFRASQETLLVSAGLINTLVLLTSSWFVVRALERARSGSWQAASRQLDIAIGLGVLFALIKLGEYLSKFSAGVSVATDTFFGFYFALTGLHFVHVTLGLLLLTYLTLLMRRRALSAVEGGLLAGAATFWHMVDLLWVFLFPLFYLVR